MDSLWIWTTFFFGMACGLLFIFSIVYIKWSGPYSWVIFKARLNGYRVSWFIDNHGEVHPEAVKGEFGYHAADAGIFLPDPDNPVSTDRGRHKGGVFDTNMAAGINFILMKAAKKLSKTNTNGHTETVSGINQTIIESNELAEVKAGEFEEEMLEELADAGGQADAMIVSAREKALDELKSIREEFYNSEEVTDEDLKKRLEDAFEIIYASVTEEFTEESSSEKIAEKLTPVIEKYTNKVEKLKKEFGDRLLLSDTEIKALRHYYVLNQPQYVEKKLQASVNEAVSREKNNMKTFMMIAAFVIVAFLAVVLAIYLLGNDPTVIIQNGSDFITANNSTTLPM
ncbi:MAG: hypothetical protein LBU81_01905 [Methanosarcinales archaeon]|jgi:predicted secreted protein|nr:hypothetical protein [Methanosarcinales archaeon]